MPKSNEHKKARDRSRRSLKKKRKTFRIRPSSGDLVTIQISARLKKGVPRKWITSALLEEMIRHKADTSTGFWNNDHCEDCKQGDDPTGISLVIIRWSNPDRLASEDQGYRYADPDSVTEQDEAWGTLRRVIAKAQLSIRLDR